MQFLDEYTLRAQIVPAGLAIIPALALALVLLSFDSFSLTETLVIAAVLGLFFAFGSIARRFGKKLEIDLFKEIGGVPSTLFLRHKDTQIDSVRKLSYHQFLASVLNESAPTVQYEEQNPALADKFYDRAGTWLREHTRNKEEFRILFNENMSYGFWRNLCGTKPLGLWLNGFVATLCLLYAFIGRDIFPLLSEATVFSLLAVSLVHALCLIFFVNRRAATEAAKSYGRQLILSCEKLMDAD